MNSGTTANTPGSEFLRKSFLVIDDFQGMRNVLRDVLRGCGADVKNIGMAANGKEAIRLLASQRFDVVLCDFNLGPGQNGQQVLEEAKVRKLVGPACAWIMITAEKTADAITGAAEYQPDSYLLKPITEAMLRQRLAKIWARKDVFVEIDGAMRAGDFAKALRLCDERIDTDKANTTELTRTKADLLLKAGNPAQARQLFEAVLAERDYPWAKAGLAKILIQNGEVASAKTLLEETIRETPYYLEAHDLLAQTLQAMGELEAAAQSLEQATKLSPNSVARQKTLGDVALKLGRLDLAERAFRKSVALGENSILKTSDAYLGLAKTCSAKSSPDEALKVLGQLNKTFSDEPTRLKSMAAEGNVHDQAGHRDKALEIANALEQELAKKGAVGADTASLDIARLLFATGKQDAAVAFLQDQVRNNPDNAALLEEVKAVFNHAEMGDVGAALVETSRQEGMEFMNRGVLQARDGQYEIAITSMREARQAMPSNVRVLFNFAYVIVTCLQKNGLNAALADEARDALQAANQLMPDQARHHQLCAALDALGSGATPAA